MAKDKVFITEGDRYLFGMGTHYEIYEKLGAHKAVDEDGREGVYFAVWAPNAAQVFVVGSFNGWNGGGFEMTRLGSSGIYELFTDKAAVGDMYKYLIIAGDGRWLYKADPYANYAEKRPGTASVITDLNGFEWTDGEWIEESGGKESWKEPMAVYEVHPGSWKKKDDGTEDGFLLLSLPRMSKTWDILILSLWEFPNILLTVHGVIR